MVYQLSYDDTVIKATYGNKTIKFIRVPFTNNFNGKSIQVVASLYTESSEAAIIEVYVDDEPIPRLTLSTDSLCEVIVEGSFNITDLIINCIHTLRFNLVNKDTTNQLLMVNLVE